MLARFRNVIRRIPQATCSASSSSRPASYVPSGRRGIATFRYDHFPWQPLKSEGDPLRYECVVTEDSEGVNAETVVFLPSLSPISTKEEWRPVAKWLAENRGCRSVMVEWPGWTLDGLTNWRAFEAVDGEPGDLKPLLEDFISQMLQSMAEIHGRFCVVSSGFGAPILASVLAGGGNPEPFDGAVCFVAPLAESPFRRYYSKNSPEVLASKQQKAFSRGNKLLTDNGWTANRVRGFLQSPFVLKRLYDFNYDRKDDWPKAFSDLHYVKGLTLQRPRPWSLDLALFTGYYDVQDASDVLRSLWQGNSVQALMCCIPRDLDKQDDSDMYKLIKALDPNWQPTEDGSEKPEAELENRLIRSVPGSRLCHEQYPEILATELSAFLANFFAPDRLAEPSGAADTGTDESPDVQRSAGKQAKSGSSSGSAEDTPTGKQATAGL